MSKQLTKVITKLANSLENKNMTNNTQSSKKKSKNKKRNQRTRSRYVRVPPPQRGILAGYGSAVTSSFRINRSNDSCVVTGFDLVPYAVSNYNYTSYFVPINPIGWLGTRAAAIASGYQNYRPIRVVLHYRPQVGSTDTKSVFIGTLWQNNTINEVDSIEPSLLTSPGGTYVPSWQSVSTVVPCGSRLPQRMYPIRDPKSQNVPFFIVARSSLGGSDQPATALPGRIFVEYTFQFHNAIGNTNNYSGWTVSNASVATLTSFTDVQNYTGVVCDSANPTIVPIGTNLSWDGQPSLFTPELNGVDVSLPTGGVNLSIGHFGTASY